MTFIDFVGYAAAVCTTLAFVPQVTKLLRERSADDISAGMYAVYIVGVGLWLAYGLFVASWPIIIANGATLCLAVAVLWMKWRFSGRAIVAARERSPSGAESIIPLRQDTPP